MGGYRSQEPNPQGGGLIIGILAWDTRDGLLVCYLRAFTLRLIDLT